MALFIFVFGIGWSKETYALGKYSFNPVLTKGLPDSFYMYIYMYICHIYIYLDLSLVYIDVCVEGGAHLQAGWTFFRESNQP